MYISDPNAFVSRLHLVVFPVPSRQQILVVDVASLNGFKVLSRSSSDKQLVSSLPGARHIGIFEWGETVVIQIGKEKIALNPKNCVVCLDKPRSVVFSCGHHAACEECVAKVSTVGAQTISGQAIRELHCFMCREFVKVVLGRPDYSSRTFIGGLTE